jgi:hypothetical protein
MNASVTVNDRLVMSQFGYSQAANSCGAVSLMVLSGSCAVK